MILEDVMSSTVSDKKYDSVDRRKTNNDQANYYYVDYKYVGNKTVITD